MPRISRLVQLRTVLSVVVAAMLTVVAMVFLIVLRNANATADMRKEAKEALLLADMDSAVQQIAVEVDRWIAAGSIASDAAVLLDGPDVRQEIVRFENAAAELRELIKSEERHLVDAMSEMFADYQAQVRALDHSVSARADVIAAFYTSIRPIESDFRVALLELQNEEIEHLERSTQTVRTAEAQLRFLVPALIVLVLGLAYGLQRLAIRARRAEEAEAINRSRSEFIASVSHELRTPLTTVVGLAHEMRDNLDRFDPGEIVEFAALLADESDEVAGIVEDLLVAARADAGSLVVLDEQLDLRAEIDHVVRMETAGGPSVRIVGQGRACADGARVRQILRNLLSNAVRYGGNDIEVGVAEQNGSVTLWVEDDGPGIPPEDRERIFEPFQRAHETPGIPAAVGLGLTVSRTLAQAMGGDLRYCYDGHSRLEVVLPAGDELSAVGS